MSTSFSISRCGHQNTINKYIRLLRQGLTPNEHTYPSLLKSLSSSHMQNPNQIHAQILKFGFASDTFVQNALLSSYAKSSSLRDAQQLFDEMCHRDAISWTAMIHGHVKNNQPNEGLRLFTQLRNLDVKIDEMVIVSVLNACALDGNIHLGRCIHGSYFECGGMKCDVYIGSSLVDMYAKSGNCDDARKVFDEMPCRNIVSWTSLISGYVHCSRFRDSISLFQDMLAERVCPNQMTLASILTACAQLGALEQGRWVHQYIKRSNLGLNPFIRTALIDMYSKCGCINDALLIFNDLSEKGVYPWTALINGLATHGLFFECFELFSQMLKDGVQPNEVTFLGVLSACSHGGLVNAGSMYFKQMCKDYAIKPKQEHFGCMVDLLGRAGKLEEALQLVETMPFEPSAAIWSALLGACVIHREFHLGEKIGKRVVEMHPQNSGGYALLASIYALSNKRRKAADLRILMRERRIEKSRGCSQIEVNGVLHEFISLDESHQDSEKIYETLAGMTILMRLEWCPSYCLLFLFDMDVR